MSWQTFEHGLILQTERSCLDYGCSALLVLSPLYMHRFGLYSPLKGCEHIYAQAVYVCSLVRHFPTLQAQNSLVRIVIDQIFYVLYHLQVHFLILFIVESWVKYKIGSVSRIHHFGRK